MMLTPSLRTQAHNRRAGGFTLIELLVVISIIALLIGILLPALGEARRRSRLIRDVANLNQHGKAIATYSAERRGRMPNINEGNGGGGGGALDLGPRGLPAFGWATIVNSASGTGYDLGSPFAHNGWVIAPGLFYDDIWRMPHLAFGDYVVDGAGVDLLNEVFVSPGDATILRNWEDFRRGDATSPSGKKLTWPEDFILSSAGSPTGQATSAWVGSLEEPDRVAKGAPPSTRQHVWMLQGSYRYTWAGMYGKRAGGPVFGAQPADEFFPTTSAMLGRSAAALASNNPTFNFGNAYRAFVQTSDANFPSQKVAFWDFWASNNAKARTYFDPDAEIAAAMVDGSARLVRTFEETPNAIEAWEALEKRGDMLGVRSVWYNQRTGHPSNNILFRDDPDDFSGIADPLASQPHPIHGPFAWFAYTHGGLRGRDFK